MIELEGPATRLLDVFRLVGEKILPNLELDDLENDSQSQASIDCARHDSDAEPGSDRLGVQEAQVGARLLLRLVDQLVVDLAHRAEGEKDQRIAAEAKVQQLEAALKDDSTVGADSLDAEKGHNQIKHNFKECDDGARADRKRKGHVESDSNNTSWDGETSTLQSTVRKRKLFGKQKSKRLAHKGKHNILPDAKMFVPETIPVTGDLYVPETVPYSNSEENIECHTTIPDTPEIKRLGGSTQDKSPVFKLSTMKRGIKKMRFSLEEDADDHPSQIIEDDISFANDPVACPRPELDKAPTKAAKIQQVGDTQFGSSQLLPIASNGDDRSDKPAAGSSLVAPQFHEANGIKPSNLAAHKSAENPPAKPGNTSGKVNHRSPRKSDEDLKKLDANDSKLDVWLSPGSKKHGKDKKVTGKGNMSKSVRSTSPTLSNSRDDRSSIAGIAAIHQSRAAASISPRLQMEKDKRSWQHLKVDFSHKPQADEVDSEDLDSNIKESQEDSDFESPLLLKRLLVPSTSLGGRLSLKKCVNNKPSSTSSTSKPAELGNPEVNEVESCESNIDMFGSPSPEEDPARLHNMEPEAKATKTAKNGEGNAASKPHAALQKKAKKAENRFGLQVEAITDSQRKRLKNQRQSKIDGFFKNPPNNTSQKARKKLQNASTEDEEFKRVLQLSKEEFERDLQERKTGDDQKTENAAAPPPARGQPSGSESRKVGNENRNPSFAYVGKTVRGKEERAKLKGFDCRECEEYYRAKEEEGLSREEILKLMNDCSKHRGLYKAPLTPEKFWDADIVPGDPDSPRNKTQVAPPLRTRAVRRAESRAKRKMLAEFQDGDP